MATDRVHLLLYRTLLFTTAIVAAVLGVIAGLEAPTITPEYQLTGYWRAYGLLVFAALSAYLGASPPGAAVLWLVVIFHKLSMTMTALLLLRHDVTGAPTAAMIDGAMVLATLIALGLRFPAARAARAARAEREELLSGGGHPSCVRAGGVPTATESARLSLPHPLPAIAPRAA